MVGIGPTLRLPGPHRGDIYWVAFPDGAGHVIAGSHPAVVVQSPAMARSSTVMVVPMTSKSRSGQLGPPYLVQVSSADSGLSRDGWIKADQIVTIDVAELGDRAGRLAPGKIEELDAALRFVLAL